MAQSSPVKLEVIDEGKRQLIGGTAAEMIHWLAQNADVFDRAGMKGVVELHFHSDSRTVEPRLRLIKK